MAQLSRNLLFGVSACVLVGAWGLQAAQPNAIPDTGSAITGTVSFEGARPRLARIQMDKDPVCAEAHSEPVYFQDGAVNSDGTLPNVFVYIKEGLGGQTFPVPATPVVLDQKGCMYEPHVLGVMVGQELQVVSSDPTTHNIHPTPKANKEWNQSQPPGAPPLVRRFAKPEIMIPVKCNEHNWMKAYIGVTSNPFYAVTGSDGTFSIKGLRPGTYTLGAWTSTFGSSEQSITVKAGEATHVVFGFTAK